MSNMNAQTVKLSCVGEGHGYVQDLSFDFFKLRDPGLDFIQGSALPPSMVYFF
jgi:hypothetical protein